MITYQLNISKIKRHYLTIDDVVNLFKQMLEFEKSREYDEEQHTIDYTQNIHVTFNGQFLLDSLVYSFTIEILDVAVILYVYTDINGNTYVQYKQYKYKLNTEGIFYVNKVDTIKRTLSLGGENNE